MAKENIKKMVTITIQNYRGDLKRTLEHFENCSKSNDGTIYQYFGTKEEQEEKQNEYKECANLVKKIIEIIES